jgi:hypothetical protein
VVTAAGSLPFGGVVRGGAGVHGAVDDHDHADVTVADDVGAEGEVETE